VLYSGFPLAICFAHGSVYMSILIFQFISFTSPCPLCVQTSILYIYNSIHSLQIGSSVPFFLDSMLLLFSYIVTFNTSQPHGLQHARLPCYSPSPRVYPSSWIGDAIQPAHPLSLSCPLPSTFPRIRVFSSESAICIRGQIIGASASESVLPMSIQG